MSPRVFITRPLPKEALRLLEGRAELDVGPDVTVLPREALLARAKEADALVSMLVDRIDDELLAAAPKLRIVANYAVGFDNVDLAAAERHGVWITNTPDAVTDATADLAIGLMISAARQMTASESLLREGRFHGWTPTHALASHVTGATLGIVGLGRIGRAMARRARGFDMRLLYTGRNRVSAEEERALGVTFVPFDTLLAESDVVSVHVPLNPDTRRLIDARALSLMKPTAVLVNTARGPIVDEAALAEALHAGKLGGAGLDVFEDEPRVHPRLLTAPRAVLVPHIGTSTVHTRVAMAEKALGDVRRVLLDAEPPRHVVVRPTRPR